MNRDTGFVLDSASHYRRTGKYLTHEQWEEQQNRINDRMNKRNTDDTLFNPSCSCGKQNGWDANYCSKCGKKLSY